MPSHSRHLNEVLATVKPARKISLVRRFWSDIQAMRENELTYKQIAEILADPYYGLQVTEQQLISKCHEVRKAIEAGKWSPEDHQASMLEPLEPAGAVESTTPAVDILGAAKSRLQARQAGMQLNVQR
jgi:hypothetical protein